MDNEYQNEITTDKLKYVAHRDIVAILTVGNDGWIVSEIANSGAKSQGKTVGEAVEMAIHAWIDLEYALLSITNNNEYSDTMLIKKTFDANGNEMGDDE